MEILAILGAIVAGVFGVLWGGKKYKDGADYHTRSLVDLVSRGGIFLLSLTPKGDGSIPPDG